MRSAVWIASAMMLASCEGGAGAGALIAAPRADTVVKHHYTFYYTGSQQTFKVPANVKSIIVVARGAAGGIENSSLRGHGRGGRVYAVIPVTPGETLYVYVGSEGGFGAHGAGYNGGALGGLYPECKGKNCHGYGGGGASDIREGGSALKDRVLVAGGGGGASGTVSCDVIGGGGGGKMGGDGGTGCVSYIGGGGGRGGTQVAGGGGGQDGQNSYGQGGKGVAGALGAGGAGGDAGGNGYCPNSCTYNAAGGGGGGGYYGGGGGGGGAPSNVSEPFGNPGGGGGGGSSYVESSAGDVHYWQDWKTSVGNGLVVFGWE